MGEAPSSGQRQLTLMIYQQNLWQRDKYMKQVLVVNRQLRLPPGKLAAQVAHAAIAAFLSAPTESQRQWLTEGMAKIVLQIDDEAALLRLYAQVQAAAVPHGLIRDAGKTVLAPGTITCLGIGPATSERIDPLTGHLPLF